MGARPQGRMTRAAGRVVFASIAAFIALRTVFTAPGVAAGLRFDPARLADRPWTVLTFPLVHESVLHLLMTCVLLVAVGPRVERRIGGRAFALFYWYSAVGAALTSVALAQLMSLPPMSGGLASAAGLLYAYAWVAGDRELSLDPLPVRARVVTLAAGFIGAMLLFGAVRNTAGLSLAHLGAVPAAWLFFRLRYLGRQPEPALPLPIRRPVLAPMQVQRADRAAPAAAPAGAPTVSMGVEDAAEAVNRLLDKISASGLESLTPEERRILTEYAERKKERE